MTREEAILYMSLYKKKLEDSVSNGLEEDIEAFNMAIKALKQEPIFDEIRAKIIEEKELAYADFERYKVEYLGQDWEDVYDSLPNDDFRYGMERAIDIIDKYRQEE